MRKSDYTSSLLNKNAVGETRIGGFRWVLLVMCWLTFLISFVDRLTWANTAVSVGGTLGLPVAGLGIFVTAFYAGYVIANFLGGIFADRFGPRMVLSIAIVSLGLFTILFSFTTSIAMGLVVQLCMGLSAGADYAACVKLMTAWFEKEKRGFAFGLFLTASSLGVLVTNAVVPTALEHMSWGTVYQILGTLTALVGVTCYVVLRDNPKLDAPVIANSIRLITLFQDRDLVFLGLAGFGAFWGTWGFAFWANALMIRGHGLSSVSAGFIVALVGVGAVLGKPIVGLVSDLFGGVRKIPIIVSLMSFAAILLVFGTLTTEGEFRIAAPFLGVAAFVYSPLIGAMVAEAAGLQRAGTATGVTSAFWQLGSVIVPVAVGFMFQVSGSFYFAFVVLAAGPLFGAICMLFVRENSARSLLPSR